MFLVYGLFFFSGVAALVYQVVWSRLLGEIFGVTVYAVTAVLAVFLGGLALGGWLLGKVADRQTKPLQFYGYLELGIAATALLGTYLVRLLDPLHIAAGNRFAPDSAALIAVRVGLAAVIVLPPTFLMGGTLPVITRAVVKKMNDLGRDLSFLYALNTFGAVLGCLLSGFVFIRWFGLHSTLWLAVVGNTLIGLVALKLAAGAEPVPVATDAGPVAETGRHGSQSVLFLAVMLVAGFSSLGLEIVWTRALVQVVGTTAYAYVTMLAGFLLGLTLGAYLARFFVDRSHDLRRVFGWIQVAVAVATLLSMPVITALGAGVGESKLAALTGGWFVPVAARFGASCLVVLLPATLIGLTFPIAGKIWASSWGDMAGRLGQLYGCNTLGNILGAATTGFLLLPWLGVRKTIVTLACLNLSLAFWGLYPKPARVAITRFHGPVAATLLGAVLLLGFWQPGGFARIGERRGDQTLLYYKEGIVANVMVVQDTRDAGSRWMTVDKIKIGESFDGVDHKQQVLAHLPFVLKAEQQPRTVLSIGLGTGILIGEVARHAGVEQVDCLEISPSVIEAARHFDQFNGAVLKRDNVNVYQDDGINFMRRTDTTYDAVISDGKSRTAHAGNAAFFSTDYYELAKQRLSDDGLMIQWIPLAVPPEELKVIFAGFHSVFPESYLWLGPPDSAFLIGTHKPLDLNLAAMEGVLHAPETKNLKRYNLFDAYGCVSLFSGDSQSLGAWLADTPTNSLEHPILEFFSPAAHGVPEKDRVVANLQAIRAVRPATLAGLTVRGADEATLAQSYQGASVLLEALELLKTGQVDQEQRALTLIDQALQQAPDLNAGRHAAAVVYAKRGLAEAESGRLAEGERLLRHAARIAPLAYDANNNLAAVLLAMDRPDEALAYFQRALLARPGASDIYFNMGNVLLRKGKYSEALGFFEKCLAINPYHAQAHNNAALSLKNMAEVEAAIASFEKAIAVDPDYIDAHMNLANLHYARETYARALAHYRIAAAARPDDNQLTFLIGNAFVADGDAGQGLRVLREALAREPEAVYILDRTARLLATHDDGRFRNGAEALILAKKAARLSGFQNPRMLDTLAAAYAEVGEFEKAQRFAAEAVRLARAAQAEELCSQIEVHLTSYAQSTPLRE